MTQIIGLGHYSRVGKDSFANALVRELTDRGIRAKKLPFAWCLKQVAHQMYAWDGLKEPEFYETPEGEPSRDIRLPTLQMTPVDVWVRLGTHAVRNNVYDLTWVDYVLKTDHGVDVLIIPDVRFPNEVRRIREHGGHLIKVVRPGYGPRLTVADLSLINYRGWDNVVGEDGSLDTLHTWAHFYSLIINENKPLPGSSKKPSVVEENMRSMEVEVLPTPEQIEKVFADAGMEVPTFTGEETPDAT